MGKCVLCHMRIQKMCCWENAVISIFFIWAASWQNQQNGCAPSEDSDQPGHPPSLIRVFAVRMKKAWVLSYPLSAQRRLWSDWADAQADLSLRWAHSQFVGFVMRRLICSFKREWVSLPFHFWFCKMIKQKSLLSLRLAILNHRIILNARLWNLLMWCQLNCFLRVYLFSLLSQR